MYDEHKLYGSNYPEGEHHEVDDNKCDQHGARIPRYYLAIQLGAQKFSLLSK